MSLFMMEEGKYGSEDVFGFTFIMPLIFKV